MPKKKTKSRKNVKARKNKKRMAAKARKPAKKKRVTVKAKRTARKKSLVQQIDEFDWRDANKIRVGVSAVAKESNTTTSPDNPPKGEGGV